MYHHKRDSGVSLCEGSDKESVQSIQSSPSGPQFSDHCSPQNGEILDIASRVDSRQPRSLGRGLHFTQLTESQRVKLFDAYFEIPPIRPNERKPKILSGYPIPYNFTILNQPRPKAESESPEEQSPLWQATYGTNGKQKGLQLFFEDYEFLHHGGESPSDEESLFNKFPTKFAAEESRQMREHAAELHERLQRMRRHHGSSESEPCDRVLPTALVSEIQCVDKEEPERSFKMLDEAWENRPPSRGHSKQKKVES